ncbi:MAG TPA: aldo/keto reductase, partial [Candidatus Sulfotelmatobacter sp.]
MSSPQTPTFIYGTAWKEERTAALVELALRAGFRAIDTANQRRHYFEAGVGEALAVAYREGVVTRAELFLQTKFTYRAGQDQRLPYDPSAKLAVQVEQSIASSLEHLQTDYVDSYVLHGPASNYGWSNADAEVWEAMKRERDAGRARLLGVSNVAIEHLEQMVEFHKAAPAFVQNRCYARLGWDHEVRQFCREHGIVYQGFSLLTANLEVLHSPAIAEVAHAFSATPAQIVFSFARAVGIVPLTGTASL